MVRIRVMRAASVENVHTVRERVGEVMASSKDRDLMILE